MLVDAMSSYHGTVCVEVRASRCLPRVLACAHGASMLLVACGWPAGVASSALLGAIALHGVLLQRALARRGEDVRRVELDPRGRWRLGVADGRVLHAELRAAPLVLPWLTALSFGCADARRRELLLLPDMVDADAFRRLRVHLLRLRAAAR